METIDDDIADATVDYIKRQHDEGNPFFVWCNFTHMHLYTHTKPESHGQAGLWQSEYHDTMIDHDQNVGTVLDVSGRTRHRRRHHRHLLHRQRPTPQQLAGRGHDAVPQREGHQLGGRVPGAGDDPLARKDQGGHRFQRHHPAPRLAADVAGRRRRSRYQREAQEGLQGRGRRNTEYKVHIDGFNLLPYLTGEVEHSPRRGFFYFSDDGELVAMRFENWKIVFMEQRCQGTLRIWAEPFTTLRVPKLFNLRTDPFEYADITSNTYYEWLLRHDYFIFYMTAMATVFLETFKEFPPRHEPASFSVDQTVEKLHKFLSRLGQNTSPTIIQEGIAHA